MLNHLGKELVEVNFSGMVLKIVKDDWKKVLPENQNTILKFDEYSKTIELKNSTRRSDINILVRYAKTIRKSFKGITKEDINNYFNGLEVTKNTKVYYLICLRKFFRFLKREEILEDVLKIKSETKYKKATELISEGEIQKLIDYYRDPCEKALIAVSKLNEACLLFCVFIENNKF